VVEAFVRTIDTTQPVRLRSLLHDEPLARFVAGPHSRSPVLLAADGTTRSALHLSRAGLRIGVSTSLVWRAAETWHPPDDDAAPLALAYSVGAAADPLARACIRTATALLVPSAGWDLASDAPNVALEVLAARASVAIGAMARLVPRWDVCAALERELTRALRTGRGHLAPLAFHQLAAEHPSLASTLAELSERLRQPVRS
jgi:hypothetical protein